MDNRIDVLCRNGTWQGTIEPAIVDACESLMGLSFPNDYRYFLLQYGCGSKNGIEIAGLGSPSFFSDASVLARTILKQREYNHYPKDLVFFSETGDGGDICFSRSGWIINEVYAVPPKNIRSTVIAHNFLEFLEFKLG